MSTDLTGQTDMSGRAIGDLDLDLFGEGKHERILPPLGALFFIRPVA